MEDDKYHKLGPLLARVGEQMVVAAAAGSDLWLFAQAGDGWVGPALFKIGKDRLEWIWGGPSELASSILAVWEAEEPGKRWIAMEYEVRGSRFNTHFYYEGELPDEEIERRDEVIRRRFGNIRVVYPEGPIPSLA